MPNNRRTGSAIGFERIEKQISELDDRVVEITTEQNKEKRIKRNKDRAFLVAQW